MVLIWSGVGGQYGGDFLFCVSWFDRGIFSGPFLLGYFWKDVVMNYWFVVFVFMPFFY